MKLIVLDTNNWRKHWHFTLYIILGILNFIYSSSLTRLISKSYPVASLFWDLFLILLTFRARRAADDRFAYTSFHWKLGIGFRAKKKEPPPLVNSTKATKYAGCDILYLKHTESALP